MPVQISVGAHGDGLAHPAPARMIKACRRDVLAAVKWNAPRCSLPGGDEGLTFRLTPLPKLQLLLHRGGKVKPPVAQPFAAAKGLIAWVAPDRGVIEPDRTLPLADPALAQVLTRPD